MWPYESMYLSYLMKVQFLTQLNEFIKRSRDQNNPEPAILYYLLWTKQKVILCTSSCTSSHPDVAAHLCHFLDRTALECRAQEVPSTNDEAKRSLLLVRSRPR
jgi:hypothetical protein